MYKSITTFICFNIGGWKFASSHYGINMKLLLKGRKMQTSSYCHLLPSCGCVQIVQSLKQDALAQKQRLAYKLEQLIAEMDHESWSEIPKEGQKSLTDQLKKKWIEIESHKSHSVINIHVTQILTLSTHNVIFWHIHFFFLKTM